VIESLRVKIGHPQESALSIICASRQTRYTHAMDSKLLTAAIAAAAVAKARPCVTPYAVRAAVVSAIASAMTVESKSLNMCRAESQGVDSTFHAVSQSLVPVLVACQIPQRHIESFELHATYSMIMQCYCQDNILADYTYPHCVMARMNALIQTVITATPLDCYQAFVLKRILQTHLWALKFIDEVDIQKSWLQKTLKPIAVQLLMRLLADWIPRHDNTNDAKLIWDYVENRVEEEERHAVQLMAEHFDHIGGREDCSWWPIDLSNIVGEYMTRVVTQTTHVFPRPLVFTPSSSTCEEKNMRSTTQSRLNVRKIDKVETNMQAREHPLKRQKY
jgi:hypothetical protein